MKEIGHQTTVERRLRSGPIPAGRVRPGRWPRATAGLAATTEKINLFASVALPTLHPAMVARMASTIDHTSGGRFGINIVSGWNQSEYPQMGVWPGDCCYDKRYDDATGYVTIMHELWSDRVSDFKGEYFQMDDCRPPTTGRWCAAGLRRPVR